MSSLLYFIIFICDISAYNLFPKYAQVYTHNSPDSYFGYSVQLQAPKQGGFGRVLVGAPRANSSLNLNHRNLNEPGAVFSCSLEGNSCEQFVLDPEGNVQGSFNNFRYRASRDHSWVGSSIDTADFTDDFFVACAPRWVDNQTEHSSYGQYGICYYLQNTDDNNQIAKKIIPLLTKRTMSKNRESDYLSRAYYYIYGETGMAVHLVQNSSTVIIGSPGIYNFTGSIITFNRFNSQDKNFQVVDNTYIKELSIYSYFGYTLSSGKFDTSGKKYFVSGAPRGNNLNGEAFLCDLSDKTFKVKFHFQGRQLGEYFGSALTVVDVNGDGYDDVIIGAPMHSTGNKADVGQVYVFINKYSTENKIDFEVLRLEGEEENARFGSSISSIGDLNKDGYADIIIGAPYYNNGRGAIYLYLGNKDGLADEYSQKILASNINSDLQAFGSSLSRGMDIDNNHYNDIAVGAYLSGQVVVIKSRPVVSLRVGLSSNIEIISLNTKSFKIFIRGKYEGIDVPQKLNFRFSLNIQPHLATFNNDKYERIITKECKYKDIFEEELDIIIMDNVQSYIQPIKIELLSQLLNNDEDKFCPLCPIVDSKSKQYEILQIPFEVGCGSDNICDTDLSISAQYIHNEPSLVIGSRNKLNVSIEVMNNGESAFSSKLFIRKTSEISLEKIPNNCIPRQFILECDIGNPILNSERRNMTLELDISKLRKEDKIVLNLNATSTGREINKNDNALTIELPLRKEAELSLIGSSHPEQITVVKKEEDTLTFVHQFDIRNMGPSPLNELEIVTLIPYKHKDTDEFLFKPQIPDICNEVIEIDNSDVKYESNKIPEDFSVNKVLHLNCDNPNILCWEVKCLRKDFYYLNEMQINITLTGNIAALNALVNENDVIAISTKTIAISQYIHKNQMTYAQTIISHAIEAASVSWIIISVSVIAGIILLIIIILILYKIHFFDRRVKNKMKKQSEMTELVDKSNDKVELNNDNDLDDDDDNASK